MTRFELEGELDPVVVVSLEKDNDGDVNILLNGMPIAFFCAAQGTLLRYTQGHSAQKLLKNQGIRFKYDMIENGE